MNISAAAEAAGLSAKMIRYYESIGLLPAARRTGNGYRSYSETDVHNLRFIRQARDLGFSLEAIGLLLSLWHDRGRESREVKRLADQHIAELEAKITELSRMVASLKQLAGCCHGDERPHCPILETLANPGADGAGRGADIT